MRIGHYIELAAAESAESGLTFDLFGAEAAQLFHQLIYFIQAFRDTISQLGLAVTSESGFIGAEDGAAPSNDEQEDSDEEPEGQQSQAEAEEDEGSGGERAVIDLAEAGQEERQDGGSAGVMVIIPHRHPRQPQFVPPLRSPLFVFWL